MQTKAQRILQIGFFALLFSPSVFAQESGSLSDHFSLEAAVDLFKNSTSPEDFEKKLNEENNQVNNLDLNEDGAIDYIRVEDHMEGEVHAIVLQAVVNEEENQDVAVIEIEKTGTEEAMLQIIGDESIFGENYIVEPFELETEEDGRGPSVAVGRVFVNVWLWPSVRFVYRPGYRVWASPFRYRKYPVWWQPRRPRAAAVFVGYRAPYRRHYRVATAHRVVRAHQLYVPRRRTSTVVRTRTVRAVSPQNRAVKGRTSTQTTTMTGPGGGQVKKRTTTTTVKGRKGKKATRKTTTTTRKRRN